MGAWGTGPYDNDTAADNLYDLALLITPMLTKWVEGGHLHDVRTACWVISQLGVSAYTRGDWQEPSVDDEGREGPSLVDRILDALNKCAEQERSAGYDEFADACSVDHAHLQDVMSGKYAAPGLLAQIADLVGGE